MCGGRSSPGRREFSTSGQTSRRITMINNSATHLFFDIERIEGVVDGLDVRVLDGFEVALGKGKAVLLDENRYGMQRGFDHCLTLDLRRLTTRVWSALALIVVRRSQRSVG